MPRRNVQFNSKMYRHTTMCESNLCRFKVGSEKFIEFLCRVRLLAVAEVDLVALLNCVISRMLFLLLLRLLCLAQTNGYFFGEHVCFI